MSLNLPISVVVGFSIGISLIILANLMFYTILGEVNGSRKSQPKFSMFFTNVTGSEVLRVHRELFPTSKKRTYMYATGVLGFLVVRNNTQIGRAHV